jgi:hypothetical protein
VKCQYPDCDGGPATGYCHVDCREEAEVMREDDLRDTMVVLGSLVLAISIVWWILVLP